MNQPAFNNPFNTTKAVDYTDAQINEAWVDFTTGGFLSIVKPTMPMPMIILGGKGSGKTHMMRYFSLNLQKIRYKNFVDELKNDAYLGIYMRCGGLNAKRFTNKGLNGDEWLQIFGYYMDLWIGQLVLESLQTVLNEADSKIEFDEQELVGQLLLLFDKVVTLPENSISRLKAFLSVKQKNIDYEINQLALVKRDVSNRIEILASPGTLIFGIPKIIKEVINYFSNFQFLYLVDEYENLEEYHQKYFNTLIRERQAPCTFRVGVRLYGIKTYETYSGGESIKEGSEYESFDIDSFLRRDEKDYSEYIRKICQRRLEISRYPVYIKPLDDYFEQFKFDVFNKMLLNKTEVGHFEKLKRELNRMALDQYIVNQIVNNLKFKSDILIERTNVILYYRFWKKELKDHDLISQSKNINHKALEYFNNRSDNKSDHFKILDKFKYDIIDQLCRENNIDFPYYGLSNFIIMSSGIPRVFLKTLKEVFKQAYFNGEDPFTDGTISKESQIKGLKISTDWFIEDAAPAGDRIAKISLGRLGDFLREIRFSDLPPECSISSFSVNNANLTEKSYNTINILKNYSYIIEVPERREKIGNVSSRTYQINGIIAPRWELALRRRGVVSLSSSEVEAIFNEESNLFNEAIKLRKKRYNYSSFKKSNDLSLFDDEPN